MLYVIEQITFLSRLRDIGEIRTLFSGEVNLVLYIFRQGVPFRGNVSIISVYPTWNRNKILSRFRRVSLTSLNHDVIVCFLQLILKSQLRYFCKGAIVADSREEATGLMVITAGQVLQMQKECTQRSTSNLILPEGCFIRLRTEVLHTQLPAQNIEKVPLFRLSSPASLSSVLWPTWQS